MSSNQHNNSTNSMPNIVSNSMKRRDFLKFFFTASIGFFILKTPFSFAKQTNGASQPKKKSVPLPEGQNEVPLTDAVAQAIGYKPDISLLDKKRFAHRFDNPKEKDHFCHNCALYTSVNEGWGKCTMMTSGLVNANGWCGSYSAKS